MLEVIIVAVPKLIAGVGTVGLGVILLRYFGPARFGIYALCVSGMLLADSVLGAAFDLGVLRLAPVAQRTDPARSSQLQRAALAVKLAVAGVLSLAIVMCAYPISRLLLETDEAPHLIRLSCVAALALLLFRTAQSQLQVEQRFAFYGALDLLHSALRFGGVGVLMMCDAVTPATVFCCFIAGPTVAFLVWAVTPPGRFTLKGRFIEASAMIELFQHTRWVLLTFSLAALTSRLDLICLTMWSSLTQVGLLSAGLTLVLIPQLLGTYLSVVLSPRVMPMWEEGRFYPFFRRFQLASFATCAALLLILIPAVRLLAPIVLPASYVPARDVIIALLPGMLAGLATFPLTLTFLMFMRPRFLFWLDCAGWPLMLVGYYFGITAFGALGAAGVTSLVCVTKATLAQIIAWRIARQPRSELSLQRLTAPSPLQSHAPAASL